MKIYSWVKKHALGHVITNPPLAFLYPPVLLCISPISPVYQGYPNS